MGINEKAWGIGFKRLIGDESNLTYGICLDNTSKALHICDIEDATTDWNVTADSYPSLYIHDIAVPSTDYVKIYHDGTSGIIDCDGTTIFAMTASTLAISADVTVTGDVGLTGDYTFTGTVNHGAEAAGERVNFYGNTAGARMVWVDAGNQLYFIGATTIMGIGTGALNWAGAASLGSLNVLATCTVQGGLSTASSLTVIGAGSFQASVGIVGSLTCNSHVIIGGNIEQTGNLHTVGVSALDGAVTLGSTLTLGGTVTCADSAMTGVGDMTFTSGSEMVAIDGAGTTLLLGAGGTGGVTFITLTSQSGGTDTMHLGKTYFYDVGGESIESNGSTLTITGPTIALTGAVTGDTSLDVTATAPTAAENAIAGFATPSATWASGEVNAVYGKTTITQAGATSTYSAAGGHFELEFSGNALSGLGLTAACMVKFTSDVEQPNAILYLESYPTGTCDLSETPFITFCDYASGSGVKSNTLLRIGDPVMAQTISTGAGKLSYNGTLRCSIYDDTSSRSIYLVTSSDQGTFTSAYPVALTYTSGTALTITQATLANDGRSMKIDTTSATPTMDDGYGAFEINGNVSGAAVGWFSPLSSWINITGSGAAGAGDYMVAQQNGVYADSGGNTGATIIFGMRAQAQLTDAPGRLCPFSLNTANRSIDALFDIAAGPSAGLVNGSPGSTADGTIPIVIDAGGTIRYVHVFSDRN